MSTNVVSAKDIKKNWHLVDAKNQVLGRLASDVATTLMGKHKPSYVPYLDSGDYVIVVNATQVKVTGKKEQQKTYFRHSGYPGGDKRESLQNLRAHRPEEVIRHAVSGMLPKTKLGKQMIKKLRIYPDTSHPYQDKLKGETV